MGNISILLADDSITIQKVVGIIFAGDGYTLTVVDNGKSAVQKAQEVVPDVLLIDALMPGMNGYEVCEAIRQDPVLSQKPILLLTGSFEPFDEAKATRSGADGHIAKPFESQQIIAKVQELYELGQQRAGGAQVAAVAEAVPVVEPVAEVPPAFEPTPSFEPAAFDPSAFEPTTQAVVEPVAATQAEPAMPDFEPSVAPAFETPVESAQPAVSPDDPWGAFTQPTTQEAMVPPLSIEPAGLELPPIEPDVLGMVSEEPETLPIGLSEDPHIGASWVPVEEQTFEFQEQVAELPAENFGTAAEEMLVVVEDEPTVTEPVTSAIEPTAVPTVAAAGALVLTDEQLKQALMSASKETIERIVWEVVPDLAEALIKETIRRITEGK